MLHPKTAFFFIASSGILSNKAVEQCGRQLKCGRQYGREYACGREELQKAKGLKVDGVAGKYTVTALGGKWAK